MKYSENINDIKNYRADRLTPKFCEVKKRVRNKIRMASYNKVRERNRFLK